VECPYCRAEVIEDAEQCPRCGKYLSREDAPPPSRGGAWMILVVLALLAIVMWITGG
jgi:predicted nucleic acid-binding Zn ribbon protein